MLAALEEARQAGLAGEVPVGAVVVRGGRIIARAHNTREREQNPLCHAEVLAIDRACRQTGCWRLDDCDLYVTLEPCAMCAGAVMQARMRRLYFGAYDPAAGYVVSCAHRLDHPAAGGQTEYYCGLMEEECQKVLRDFFSDLRKR